MSNIDYNNNFKKKYIENNQFAGASVTQLLKSKDNKLLKGKADQSDISEFYTEEPVQSSPIDIIKSEIISDSQQSLLDKQKLILKSTNEAAKRATDAALMIETALNKFRDDNIKTSGEILDSTSKITNSAISNVKKEADNAISSIKKLIQEEEIAVSSVRIHKSDVSDIQNSIDVDNKKRNEKSNSVPLGPGNVAKITDAKSDVSKTSSTDIVKVEENLNKKSPNIIQKIINFFRFGFLKGGGKSDFEEINIDISNYLTESDSESDN